METVAVPEATSYPLSETVYVNDVLVPLKPAFGVNVNVPSAFNTTFPSGDCVAVMGADKVSPFGSVSFAKTVLPL